MYLRPPVRACDATRPLTSLCAPQTEEKKVRKQLAARYQTVETRKDGVKFTSKALAQAAERLQAVSREYDRCQHALVEQASGHQTPETLNPNFSYTDASVEHRRSPAVSRPARSHICHFTRCAWPRHRWWAWRRRLRRCGRRWARCWPSWMCWPRLRTWPPTRRCRTCARPCCRRTRARSCCWAPGTPC